MSKVICGPCKKVFANNDKYLKHKCSKADGATPTTPEYLERTTTPNFSKIAAKAQERGSAK